MQISYELSETDFSQAYVAHRNRTALGRWARRIFLGCMILVALCLLAVFLIDHNAQAVRGILPGLALALMWITIVWALPRWTMRRQFRKQPGAHGARNLLLDTAGAHWRWNGGTSDVEWRNYIRWLEGNTQILFYTSPACFNILPKRALTIEQLDELREVLKKHIPPKQ
jgi:hypothetical protein